MLNTETNLDFNVPAGDVGVNQVFALFQHIQQEIGPLLEALLGRSASPRSVSDLAPEGSR